MGEHKVIPLTSALRAAKRADFKERKKIEEPDTRSFKAQREQARAKAVREAQLAMAIAGTLPQKRMRRTTHRTA